MMRWFRLRAPPFGSLPTIVVLVVVVAVGARLMYLSVQHHADAAREAAIGVGADFAAKMQPRWAALANLASRRAASPESAHDAPPHGEHTFWMAANDTVLRASSGESALAEGIASEWRSAESARALPSAAILGPMRLGSGWIVAARVPPAAAPAGNAPGRAGWAVAYSDLEDLIADSHLARLADMGYDFQLAQIMPRDAQPRIFVGSTFEPLADAVSTPVRLPMATTPGSRLELTIRPRTGWYPASLLAADVGLLVFLAWLLAFGTHDLSHALQRSRAALTATRGRLRSMNHQLASEIQQRQKLQETFSHALFHDAFTGLPNRRYFMDQLDRALRDMRAKQRTRIAVIIIDITRFRLVNDLLGHTAGDELMVQAARRFEKSAAGFEGVLARWGGDQFALLILKLESTGEASHIGGLLREELRFPFQLRRHQLVVAASVGITCTDDGQVRAEDLVREADIALSVAKQSEGSKIVPYAPNMSSQAATLVSLEADLHVALEKHQLQLLLQPVVDLRTHRMVGAEALLRWLHPVEGVLAPDRFLRIAEEAGLMVPITRWVILRAMRIAADWRRRVPEGQSFYISVNLSPTALRDPALPDYVATQLREAGIPAELIKLEVTEAALIDNVGATRETLEQMHSLGIGLMLDDFGTGFSSLSNLQLFPFDFVKIERPFVNLNNADQANTGMMAAMVQMAASLKLTAIAEIVESEAAATALRQMGCEFGQGYYFSEPIESEQALRRLSSQEPFQPRGASNTLEVPALPAYSPVTRLAAPPVNASPTVIIAPLGDPSPTRIVAPSADASPTVIIAPLDDPSPTRIVAPPADASPTVIIAPLGDPSPTQIVAPPVDASPTVIIAPPGDPSPTLVIPRPAYPSSPAIVVPTLYDSVSLKAVPPAEDTASTVAVRTLDEYAGPVAMPVGEDSDNTVAVPTLDDSVSPMAVPPAEDTASTMAVPTLDDSVSPMAAPPAEDTASTMAVPTLDDSWLLDSSPTAVMPPLFADSSPTMELPPLRELPQNSPTTSRKIRDGRKNAPPREDDSSTTVTPTGEDEYGRGKNEAG